MSGQGGLKAMLFAGYALAEVSRGRDTSKL